MAVTLQIARLQEAELIKCLHHDCTLQNLLNFSLLPPKLYLDLNWEVIHLRNLLRKINDEGLSAYEQAIEGIHDFPEALKIDVVEERPRFNLTEEVPVIFGKLQDIQIDLVIEALPSSLDEKNQALGGHYESDPSPFLTAVFHELNGFYELASSSSQSIVCWWD